MSTELVPPTSTPSHLSKFTPGRFENICNELLNSTKSVKAVCAENGICVSTFYYWIDADSELKERYYQMRRVQAELLVLEILEIANDNSNDTITDEKTGKQYPNWAVFARTKVMLDIRKWLVVRFNPVLYGDAALLREPEVPDPVVIDWTGEVIVGKK